jgi:hypothetical protein
MFIFYRSKVVHFSVNPPILTPKGLNVLGVTKPVLGSVTWPHFIFIFFETFCEHASRNKLCGSTNLMIFGPMDQKLWMFENFRRSLGKAGMCWSQIARVDHMCKNTWTGGRRIFLATSSLGHPRVASGWPAGAYQKLGAGASWQPTITRQPWPGLTDYMPFLVASPFLQFLDFFLLFFWCYEDGCGIFKEWVYSTPIFLSLPLHLGGWNFC